MKNIAAVMFSTPWWVFPLLGYLIVLGIQSRRTRIVSLYKLFVLPVIFLVISFYTLMVVTPDYIVISCWLAAMIAGSACGFFQLVRTNIQVDAKRSLIQIPGSWSNLIIMLLIFSSRYYFGYDLAVNPHHYDLIEYRIIRFAISGLLTGYLQGKLLGYLYHFKNATELRANSAIGEK